RLLTVGAVGRLQRSDGGGGRGGVRERAGGGQRGRLALVQSGPGQPALRLGRPPPLAPAPPPRRAALPRRWVNALPAAESEAALTWAGLDEAEATALTAARPLADAAATTAAVAALQPTDGPDGEQS
ncbi:hypothetical protein, partial [Saccharothrix sp. ST-888]|uniref:hypothetical protein n=1 Tax=Saccharothrix sp. ST-888 TaxID=1427391 RepID=UPI0005ECE8C4